MMRLRRYVAATAFSLFGLVFGLRSAASAATYYVSPAGNNNNPGTSTTLPWRTIDKVNDTFLSPGTRVLFQGGQTFTGMVYLRPGESGTLTNLITIGSYGTGAATINGGG